jgi:uncharacterized protein (DUF1015 family)
MRATRTQLSPIFGIYSDPNAQVPSLLQGTIARGQPTSWGTTAGDGVKHEIWAVTEPDAVAALREAIQGRDVFIADGHHRYNTALTYQQELAAAHGGQLPPDHPANWCMFVLIAMQDPGMIVLPTHRVLGGMSDFSLRRLEMASGEALKVTPFDGDLAGLEKALPRHGPHAMGLFAPHDETPLAIVTTTSADPLAATHADKSRAWRQLDVAVVQHLIVEQICEPAFCSAGSGIKWKFPHSLEQLERDTRDPDFQVGLIVQSTPLESVRLVSEAGELMPQKSTFFYPKLVTGMVMNPLE